MLYRLKFIGRRKEILTSGIQIWNYKNTFLGNIPYGNMNRDFCH